ncbi:CLUMA_CG017338, isoform A [Clunio marinus]|uniref:CLUMA_CG017338, isoform A n=1 Tax=Clunio marinus TaxID=568069 RepID=A0A1J1IVE2_9DIPT|nr:CLUMA_CG017338, isoform A [Clunio marinus]
MKFKTKHQCNDKISNDSQCKTFVMGLNADNKENRQKKSHSRSLTRHLSAIIQSSVCEKSSLMFESLKVSIVQAFTLL